MNGKQRILNAVERTDGLVLGSAPGRVNLIGEHTDYNGGLVLPIAIDARTYVGFHPDDSRDTMRIHALDWDGETLDVPLTGPFPAIEGGGWKNYVLGVLEGLEERGIHPRGGELYISGDVPQGAGLSSSASLEVALMSILAHLNGATLTPLEAAKLGQRAEHTHAGCACGLMDQWVSAGATSGHALLIDCGELISRDVVWPSEFGVLVVDSGIRRELAGSGYNDRRQECEAAAQACGVESLSLLNYAELAVHEEKMSPASFKRAKHVVLENERTRQAVEALEQGRMNELFGLLRGSHDSLSRDFEVTVPETDMLARLMNEHLDGQGGARMTGGGFGGCVIGVAPVEVLERTVGPFLEAYSAQTGIDAESYLFTAGPGPLMEKI